jgi:phosphoenolpyruvate carboxykinase (ATP)
MGGPYGTGRRIDLPSTRNIINAILNKTITDVPYSTLPVFNLKIPQSVPGVPSSLLDPRQAWGGDEKWNKAAVELAEKFRKNFSKFTSNPDTAILAQSGPEI